MLRRASGLLLLVATALTAACSSPTAPQPTSEACPIYGQGGTC